MTSEGMFDVGLQFSVASSCRPDARDLAPTQRVRRLEAHCRRRPAAYAVIDLPYQFQAERVGVASKMGCSRWTPAPASGNTPWTDDISWQGSRGGSQFPLLPCNFCQDPESYWFDRWP